MGIKDLEVVIGVQKSFSSFAFVEVGLVMWSTVGAPLLAEYTWAMMGSLLWLLSFITGAVDRLGALVLLLRGGGCWCCVSKYCLRCIGIIFGHGDLFLLIQLLGVIK